MVDLSRKAATEFIDDWYMEDNIARNSAIFLIQDSGADYKKICIILSSLYEKQKKTDSGSNSASFIETYMTKVIGSIDAHTEFFSGKKLISKMKRYNRTSQRIGITFRPTKENGHEPFRITTVMPNSSALEKGFQVDDIITHINGLDCSKMTLKDISNYIYKHDGSFSFKILRNGETLEIDGLNKEKVRWPTVASYFIHQDGLAYIRISAFSHSTGVELDLEILKLKEVFGSDMKGILIDVRDNLGGSLGAAIHTIDTFIDRGPVLFSYEPKNTRKITIHHATQKGSLTDAPILILVNNYSISGSELVSSVLQDYGRALIVGTRTFGKGTILNVLVPSPCRYNPAMPPELWEDKSAIFYTSSIYYRLTGKTVQLNGVTPDIEIVDPKREKLMREFRQKEEDAVFYESDYEKAIEAESIIEAESADDFFRPPYSFRQQAKARLAHVKLRADYSKMERVDIQLAQAIDYLKILTGVKTRKNHFGPAYYYRSPYHRLHINTDLYEENANVRARFQFKIKKGQKEKLIYETIGVISGNELTLSLEGTPVEEYVNRRKNGNLRLHIDVKKKTDRNPKVQIFSHDTIVIF